VSESSSGEHQELEGRFQAVVSERYGASGAPTAELSVSNVRQAADRANYVVGISNGTDSTFTVLVVFGTSDSPDPQEIADEILPGEATAFVLTPRGQCASLVGYVMGFFLDDQLAFRSPEEGVWTPERVSQETGDTDPCSDIWQLGPA
jgi:hypothetical protein